MLEMLGLVSALGVLGTVEAPEITGFVWVHIRGCEGPNSNSTNRNTEGTWLSIQ